MVKKICYCFDYTDNDIRSDIIQNDGRSLILEKIVVAKQNGSCECASRHPEGR